LSFIPPVQLHVESGHRAIFEILISLNNSSVQAYFWRCDATNPPGTITRLDSLGAQIGRSGGDPVLGPLLGNQSNTPTSGMIQATAQISGSTSSVARNPTQGGLQLGYTQVFPDVGGEKREGGAGYVPQFGLAGSLTFSSTTSTKNPPQPQYNLSFTADIILKNAPAAPQTVQSPTVPDQQFFVNFANDSASISSAEVTRLLRWANITLGTFPHLKEAIRTGQVLIVLTGRASIRGNAQHNLGLSQRRVDAVRVALEGAASATAGGRTQGGILGSEALKVDSIANGDFHDPMPTDIDQDRVVEIFIDGAAATSALQHLANSPTPAASR
jgi:hypothetical protein